jgi:hypothetical protein
MSNSDRLLGSVAGQTGEIAGRSRQEGQRLERPVRIDGEHGNGVGPIRTEGVFRDARKTLAYVSIDSIAFLSSPVADLYKAELEMLYIGADGVELERSLL